MLAVVADERRGSTQLRLSEARLRDETEALERLRSVAERNSMVTSLIGSGYYTKDQITQ